MGLVHSYKKGEVPTSKVSKAVKDAAKSMDTKSVKKYASTKHKGKPEKVNKEFIVKKIRELLDTEMESCGYTMSAKDPSYKLKSPGGTGDEDKRLKEVITEGEKEKIEKLLIKYGNTPEDAKQMISKTYDYIKKAYRKANASKKAEIMSGLMKFETTEDFGSLVEKCWKGYMIHPKRKTKKLFGKTYPNCVKKEGVQTNVWLGENELYYESNTGESGGYTFEFIDNNNLQEAEYQGRKVKLGKIMQGDAKKFKVYVKNPKGNVVKVNFGQGGDAKGGTMRIRKSNPKARANFRARHNCDNPGPRHKARYWSCRAW